MIHHGDCLDVMATLPAASVDAIVTDPPYGLEFMGKEWDRLWDTRRGSEEASPGYVHPVKGKSGNWRNAPTYGTDSRTMQEWHHRWATEALRVAKPGAYLLAFGGTRTYHRLACAIEDAGWIIRDCLVWAYASGFPKSRALLKPAWEPIVMARKPGPLRELAIDACRIGMSDEDQAAYETKQRSFAGSENTEGYGGFIPHTMPHERMNGGGRWPANVILTDPIFDGGVGGVGGVVGGGEAGGNFGSGYRTPENGWGMSDSEPVGYGDTGTYSRFFLVPKSSRSDREPNAYGRLVGGLEERPWVGQMAKNDPDYIRADGIKRSQNLPRQNAHPTVKPLDLMRHLVRLVTPAGGTVLDPFLGSGTTAIAAEMEGFAWIGIEREESYVEIAEARLQGVQRGLGLDVAAPTTPWKDYPTATRYPVKGPSRSSWFTESTRYDGCLTAGCWLAYGHIGPHQSRPVGGVDLHLFSGVAGPAEGEEVG